MKRFLSWTFWFPIDAAINLIRGYSISETWFLYRLAWRLERDGRWHLERNDGWH